MAELDWQSAFASRRPLYERLQEELRFTLEQEIGRANVKLHSLTSRVKTVESLSDKARRKRWTDPLAEAGDIVGARVVVLFTSDLPRVHSIITSAFDVFSTEDKVEGSNDPSTFGYMSMHYGATISDKHRGPRYDELCGLRFEVQTRTILMDAWANVSHHLAYKDESSIPQELRKDFHALSGLFYVADKHFELFFARSRQVEQQASNQLRRAKRRRIDLNLETLSAFLRQRYPERKHSPRDDVAELVTELHRFRYTDLKKLESMLSSMVKRFEENEQTGYGRGYYNDVGVVRSSLALKDPNYNQFLTDKAMRQIGD